MNIEIIQHFIHRVMTTVETSLGHFEEIADELALRRPVSYVFKLGCGCSVYNKEDVLGHLWDKCEHQDSEFWCERHTEYGRTVKHHIRVDEIDTIWAGAFVEREDVPSLRDIGQELDGKLEYKKGHDYVKILKTFEDPLRQSTMSVLEEKNMRDQITEWYLREDVKPPQFSELLILALAKIACDSIISEFEKDPDLGRLTVFGFGDSLT